MNQQPTPSTYSAPHPWRRLIVYLLLGMTFMGCSSGLRLKNLFNVPVAASRIQDLDTMRVAPDILNYQGSQETLHRVFNRSIEIRGDRTDRPIWMSDDSGCFRVENGAELVLTDFNFNGERGTQPIIQIDSGSVTFENCDFFGGDQVMIELGAGATLNLQDTRFFNIGAPGIHMNGGITRVYTSSFENLGDSPITSSAGQLLEVHQSQIIGNQGHGLELVDVQEVWLDSTHIAGNFKDGVFLEACDFTFISHVTSQENGRHGINLSGGSILGMLQSSAQGNLLAGMVATDLDSIHIVSSKLIGNRSGGADLGDVLDIRVLDGDFSYNEGHGLKLLNIDTCLLDQSKYQGNSETGLHVTNLGNITSQNGHVLNNSDGIFISEFGSISMAELVLAGNQGIGCHIDEGESVKLGRLQILKNGTGLDLDGVLRVEMDSSVVIGNQQGTNIANVAIMKTHANTWRENQGAASVSHINSVISSDDSWLDNRIALELLSSKDFAVTRATLNRNDKGVILAASSLLLEDCRIDSTAQIAVQNLSGNVRISNSKMAENESAIEVGEGAKVEVIQSNFRGNKTVITALASSHVFMSSSHVSDSRQGITFGNFAEVTILSTVMEEIDGPALHGTGPYHQKVLLRQNVLNHTGNPLKSEHSQGDIELVQNTFSDHLSAMGINRGSDVLGRQNIFWNIPRTEELSRLDDHRFQFNAVPDSSWGGYESVVGDPQFSSDYWLKPGSPCLLGGENQTLIGARGINPIQQPELKP